MDADKLTRRARNVLQMMGVSQQSDLTALSQMRGQSPLVAVLREPNCGRKTAAEIMQWYESAAVDPMPQWLWVRIRRDANLRWCVFGASVERRDGEDWYLAEIRVPPHVQPPPPIVAQGEK